jgi:hypothetical protein
LFVFFLSFLSLMTAKVHHCPFFLCCLIGFDMSYQTQTPLV